MAQFNIEGVAKLNAIHKTRPPHHVPWDKTSLTRNQAYAAFLCYLDDRLEECVARARDDITLADDAFFGDWRKSVPNVRDGGIWPAEKWLELSSLDAYRWSILWCSCLGDWDSARRLSQYPSERTREIISERKSEALWYQLLAAYLRGEQPQALFGRALGLHNAAGQPPEGQVTSKPGSFERLIEEGRSKRMRLLASALVAIAQPDYAPGFQQRIEQYLAYYRKNEFPRRDWEDKVSIDGSILVHLADYKGVKVEVSPAYADHIVRLPPELIARSQG